MRLVVIEGDTYSVYEGRTLLAAFTACYGPLSAEEVERLRTDEYAPLEAA